MGSHYLIKIRIRDGRLLSFVSKGRNIGCREKGRKSGSIRFLTMNVGEKFTCPEIKNKTVM